MALNYTEAARYFRLAADLSNPEAQYNLGVLYMNGEVRTRVMGGCRGGIRPDRFTPVDRLAEGASVTGV